MIVVLAGPPAVGHNTIAELLAQARQRAAIIDNDVVREMVVRPEAIPGSGSEWDRQYDLSIRNLCALARNFDQDGTDVFIVDVVEPEIIPVFRRELSGVTDSKIILLMADLEILIKRDTDRDGDPGNTAEILAWHDRIRHVRDQLSSNVDLYDHCIDSSAQEPAETARAVERYLDANKAQ